MRFIFVDAENIGLKEVENITASISDKVLVFSKNDAIKEVCERNFFLFISSYPAGTNQADFYIIGNLVGLIASLTQQQQDVSQFILYSQDNALVSAFTFQCVLHKVQYNIALEPKVAPQVNITKPKTVKSIEQRVLEQFKTAQPTEHVRKSLKLPKSDFTRVLNILIKQNKIKRVSKNKKTWVHA